MTRQGAYLEIKDALGKTKATHVDKLVMSRCTNMIRSLAMNSVNRL